MVSTRPITLVANKSPGTLQVAFSKIAQNNTLCQRPKFPAFDTMICFIINSPSMDSDSESSCVSFESRSLRTQQDQGPKKSSTNIATQPKTIDAMFVRLKKRSFLAVGLYTPTLMPLYLKSAYCSRVRTGSDSDLYPYCMQSARDSRK